MAIRRAVRRVIELAPLPREHECPESLIHELESAVADLPRPATDEEAGALLKVLDTPDDATYFGLLWSVVHTVEPSPGWPLAEICVRVGPWFDHLRTAARNAGLTPPP